MFRYVVAALCAVAATVTPPTIAAPPLPKIDFNRDIRPILSENCFHCHGPDAGKRKADLRFDQRDVAVDQGAIVPGDPDSSELVTRIFSTDPDETMPPPESKRMLTGEQRALLRLWITQGAPYAPHWAYVAPARPELPEGTDPGWPANPIDNFVLARLDAEGLEPSPEAGKEALIRRVTLDLTGLPPAPREIEEFLSDTSPDAYEKVVDRLLASGRYGERMVWEWLDAARYADSNGYQGDPERTMWPWRDWVIQALNENMPFDQFTIEQLAGDLLPEATLDQKVATGFNRNHMHNGEGGRIAEETRVENVMDRTETTATVWMGITLGCARCHDHKYDPFTQKEYYQIFAFFNSTPENGDGRTGKIAPAIDLATPDEKSQLSAAEKEVASIGAQVDQMELAVFPRPEGKTSRASPRAEEVSGNILRGLEQAAAKRGTEKVRQMITEFEHSEPEFASLLKKLNGAIDARDRARGEVTQVMVMSESQDPRETFVLVRGAYDKPAEKVVPEVPATLPPLPSGCKPDRLALARWLVDPEHPLTARVTVNRYWQTFFGGGLVKTAEDFGVQGEPPSHPELLDWLARRFIESGWDVKTMHKLIVMSAAYRQSSRVSRELQERDPANRLLARGARYRIPSWMLRDQALSAGGLLVEIPGGPPVRPYQPAGIWEDATFGKKTYVQDHGEALYRRSLYTFWRRIVGPTMFFDTANRQTCTIKSVRTNTPLQALILLNEPAYVESARAFAEVLLTEGGYTPGARIETAYRRLLARGPTASEVEILLARLEKLRAEFAAEPDTALQLLAVGESPRNEDLDPVEHAAYAALCSLLLNLDETLTKQ